MFGSFSISLRNIFFYNTLNIIPARILFILENIFIFWVPFSVAKRTNLIK